MSDPSELGRRVAYLIAAHLQEELRRGAVQGDAAESVEVALACLQQAYSVNATTAAHADRYGLPGGQSLAALVERAASGHASAAAHARGGLGDNIEGTLDSPDQLKEQGNALLKEHRYQEAVDAYSRAIEMRSDCAVYYANRAAARTGLRQYEAVIEDCNAAIALDGSYSKAYSRKGLALMELGRFGEARDAYAMAVDLEPDNAMYRGKLEEAERRARSGTSRNPAGGPAGGRPSAPGGATDASSRSGSMPDLGSLLSNPNIMQFAQQMMRDPAAMQMASQLMSGAGGGGGGGAGGAGGSMPDIANLARIFGAAQGAPPQGDENPDQDPP